MKQKVVTIDVDSGDMWRGAVMLYLVVVVVYCAWMISIINNNVTVTMDTKHIFWLVVLNAASAFAIFLFMLGSGRND